MLIEIEHYDTDYSKYNTHNGKIIINTDLVVMITKTSKKTSDKNPEVLYVISYNKGKGRIYVTRDTIDRIMNSQHG